MTQHVTIIQDVFNRDEWVSVDCPDMRDAIAQHFASWPANARLYHGTIVQTNDITPMDDADWNRLPKLTGPFYMVVYPSDPVTIAVNIAIAVLLSVTAYLLAPAPPSSSGQSRTSSNNDLADRQNQARPLQRIPDIMGQVRSTPDLLGVPVRVFENKQEVEYSIMCVGRGAYEIEDVKDDTTLVSELEGASIEVYGPGTSPLSADDPEILIGDAITEPLNTVRASTAINGQILYAPNYKSINMATIAPGGIGGRFQADGKINAPALDWAMWFEPGDEVTVTGATYTESGSGYSVDLDGTYTVSGIGGDGSLLEFEDPELINSDWNTVALMADDRTAFLFPLVEVTLNKTVGPFTMDVSDLEQVWVNLVAPGGLFRQGSGAQERVDVDVEMELTPVDEDGTPTGSPETFEFTVIGAGTTRSLLGLTCKANPTFTGRCTVSMIRTSFSPIEAGVQVVDEIRWRDLYAISPVGVTNFGDVTTVYSRSLATPAALGLKERKLNMLATRKIPERDGDGFTETLTASRSVADIFCFAATDPYIGGREVSELDIDQIYDEIDEVADYFGDTAFAEFGYTFDDDQISFEETLATIARAAFCEAQRNGSRLQLFFERATNDSTILFNHRNKLPGSEKRTVSFGRLNDNDGVEYTYVDKDNYDSPRVYRIPEDGTALKPKKIEGAGQRNFSQVYAQAWREFNKIQYQHSVVEFSATSEAALVGRLERILVADNTRVGTQDGEVVSQDGLTLTLSQKVTFEPGQSYKMFLQIPDGTVQVIDITEGATAKEVVLFEAPAADLSLDPTNFARATYWVVPADDGREQAFLVSEKRHISTGNFEISAVNYDARYYEKDVSDIGDVLVTADGSPLVTADGTYLGY